MRARYSALEPIGVGAYGEVFRGLDSLTSEEVALKRTCLSPEGVPATTLREVNLLRKLHHPCVVSLRDVTIQGRDGSPSVLWIVLEFMPQDLRCYLSECFARNQLVPPADLRSLTFQILSAVAFCSSYGVLHRDLKPSNVLIDPATRRIKVADFGLARVERAARRPLTEDVQTLWYRAPEVLLGLSTYSAPVDVWSVACLFSEVATLRPLFQGTCQIDQLYRIFTVTGTPTEKSWPGVSELPHVKASAAGMPFTELWPCWPAQDPAVLLPTVCALGRDLFWRMLCPDPAVRVNSVDALRHPYFDGVESEVRRLADPAFAAEGEAEEELHRQRVGR